MTRTLSIVLRLIFGKFRANLDGICDSLIEIVDLDIEMHRHLRFAFNCGPYRPLIKAFALKCQVECGIF